VAVPERDSPFLSVTLSQAVTNNLSHVLKFTGHKVNLRVTGAHGKALPMQGALCAFPTVDVKGKSCTITFPGISAYSPE
jgi:hypothetical protein